MKIDWKLKGLNLLKFNCNKDQIVHPETCSDMVLMGHDGEINLTDWLTTGGMQPFPICDNLAEWITTNLSSSLNIDTTWTPNIANLDDNNSISLGYIASNNTNPVRVPYGSVSQIGLLGINSSSSFSVTNGILSLNEATSNYYGGIKLGFANTENKYKVELDSNGKAFVDIGTVSATSYLKGWNIIGSIYDTTAIATVYDSNDSSDHWSYKYLGLKDLSGYTDLMGDLYSVEPTNSSTIKRLYPIKVDKYGLMYSYIPWKEYSLSRPDTNTNILQWYVNGVITQNIDITPANGVTYSGTTTSGYLTKFSASGVVTNGPALGTNDGKYLRHDGEWTVPYTTFSISNNGLVPASGANTTKFLKGDGTWAVPYEISTVSTDNSVGGTLVVARDLEGEFTIAEPGESLLSEDQEALIPVVYAKSEDINYHGVELSRIINALINNTDLLTALKTALEGI